MPAVSGQVTQVTTFGSFRDLYGKIISVLFTFIFNNTVYLRTFFTGINTNER